MPNNQGENESFESHEFNDSDNGDVYGGAKKSKVRKSKTPLEGMYFDASIKSRKGSRESGGLLFGNSLKQS